MLKHKVVLVPFPFDDISTNKVRPAVCLTDPIGPHSHMMTTTQTLLRRELGALSATMQAQVNDRLRKLFDLK